jgi:hypothetical protein
MMKEPMKLKATLHFTAPAAVVSRMLIAPDFQELIAQQMRATECSTVVGRDQITATYLVPTMTGYADYASDHMKLIGKLRWTSPLRRGRQTGELTMTTEHFPTRVEGTVTVRETGDSTEVVYNIGIISRVPFLDAKLERMIGDSSLAIIEAEQDHGLVWLQRHQDDPAPL